MKRLILIAPLLAAAFAFAGCSGNKAEKESPLAVSDADLGPETKDLIKDLPEGLVGDKENARYIAAQLRGEDDDGN